MYLIQLIPTDTGSMIAIMVISYLISIWILYAVIKAAVKSGTKDILTQLRFQNNLKVEEMMKEGYSIDRLKTIRVDSEVNN